MRIGLFDPFLSALGGGKKYFLTVLEEACRAESADVLLIAPEEPRTDDWRRLGIEVGRDRFEWAAGGAREVTRRSRGLDLLFAMVNDVPPRSHARRSVAMVQFPHRRHQTRARRVLGRTGLLRATSALRSYDLFVVNSHFTRAHVERRLGVRDAAVIPPPVDPPPTPTSEKGRWIAAVGRFDAGDHDKRQEALVRAFAELRRLLPAADRGWELHLVGGAEGPEARERVERLRSLAGDEPVAIHVDAPREELERVYARSTLFWHAAGYAQDPERHPERLEHFGISTAEAMMRGAVPLVVGLGGQREVVDDGRTCLYWEEPEELAALSAELIADDERRERLAAAAATDAARFAAGRFREEVRRRILAP
jgi:glycosyltransferase involved in cell wall biosynthesis